MLLWPEISRLKGGATQVGTLEATRLMNQGTNLVLDIRDGDDFASGHVPRARHIPLSQLSKRVDEIGKFKDKTVIVTCRTGAKTGAAARLLRNAGFTRVFELRGGVNAWQQASLPVEK
ncbi:MAG: rhodanese-like domain-containing protein [Burkholderiales bacterium]|nr:rhodanese-like domain-containing protein [Burkholderiales bacterium]